MGKKLFVCSDVHGFYDEWMSELKKAGYDSSNHTHKLIVCGDLLDRGKQANQCLKFINDLPDVSKIVIRGNHELLMDDILYKKRYFDTWDYSNGTVNTIEQITGISQVYDGKCNGWEVQQIMIEDMRNDKAWKQYYGNTVMFAEIGNYIFVHGWIPCELDKWGKHPVYRKDWRDVSYWDWKDATWLNGMSAWDDGVKEPNKTIVCGHWHTSWGHTLLHNKGVEWDEAYGNNPEVFAHFEPFEDEGIIAMDACTAYSGQVNVKVLEVTDEEWSNKIIWNK